MSNVVKVGLWVASLIFRVIVHCMNRGDQLRASSSTKPILARTN